MYDVLQAANQNSREGQVKIHLYAHLPDGHIAEMNLKGRYDIPSDMLSLLQKTPGFIKYSEA